MATDSKCLSKSSAITSRSENPTASFEWEIQECLAILNQNGGKLKSPSFSIPGVEGQFNILLAITPKSSIEASVEGEGVAKGQKLAGKLEIKHELYTNVSTTLQFGCEKNGNFLESWIFSPGVPLYSGCWSLDATIIAPGTIVVTEEKSQEIKNSTFTCQPLLDNPKHSDILIRCGDKAFRCHKNILSMRCEVFDRMFESGMVETAAGEVTVTDVPAEIMEMLLEFIYTGEVRDRAACLDELLYAGHKYLLLDLVKMYGQEMISQLTCENAVSVLLIGDTYQLDDLKKAAMSLIVANKARFLKDPEFLEKVKNNPDLMMELLSI